MKCQNGTSASQHKLHCKKNLKTLFIIKDHELNKVGNHDKRSLFLWPIPTINVLQRLKEAEPEASNSRKKDVIPKRCILYVVSKLEACSQNLSQKFYFRFEANHSGILNLSINPTFILVSSSFMFTCSYIYFSSKCRKY